MNTRSFADTGGWIVVMVSMTLFVCFGLRAEPTVAEPSMTPEDGRVRDCLEMSIYTSRYTICRLERGANGELLVLPEHFSPRTDTAFLTRENGSISLWAETDCKWSELMRVDENGNYFSYDHSMKKLESDKHFRTYLRDPSVKPKAFEVFGVPSKRWKSKDADSALMFKSLSGEFVGLPRESLEYKGVYKVTKIAGRELRIYRVEGPRDNELEFMVGEEGNLKNLDSKHHDSNNKWSHWSLVDEDGYPALPPKGLWLDHTSNSEPITVHENGLVSFPAEEHR